MANIVSNTFYKLGEFFGGSEKGFFNPYWRAVNNKGVITVDTDIPYKLFNEISELHQVVDKKAAMLSNGIFKLVKADNEDEEIDAPELMALLENPNVLQSQNKWLHNYSTQLDVYGNQFMYFNWANSLQKVPTSIVNISPRYLDPILTGRVYDQASMDGIIKNYKFKQGDIEKIYKTKDILWTKHDDLDNPVVGRSPLVSLKFPLSNTKLAYQYFNVISGESGALGMISGETRDGAGSLPMSEKDRTALEKQYTADYGIQEGKKKVAIVSSNVKYTPTSPVTKDLQLQEQIDANKLVICDQYGLDINIFSSKNSTYENVRQALIGSYNNSIIPAANALTQSLSEQLKIDDDKKLILDYSHLSILQEDEKEKADIVKAQLDSVTQAVSAGLIDNVQAADILNNSFGLEVTPAKPKEDE
jgi:phage portal protein BeeE